MPPSFLNELLRPYTQTIAGQEIDYQSDPLYSSLMGGQSDTLDSLVPSMGGLSNVGTGGDWRALIPDPWERTVLKASRKYGLDPNLIAAVGKMESGWRTGDATSSAGAMGPLQTMPFWSDSSSDPYGAFNPNARPRRGIMLGAHILDSYLDQMGNRRQGLAAYNAGPSNYQAGMGYASSVLDILRGLLS